MKRDLPIRAAVFCALVTLAVSVRLVSETPNFGAVTAAALFAGFYFRRALTAACVPLVTMLISDYFIGGYSRSVMLAVYGSLLIPIAWRSLLRADLTPARVGLGTVSSTLAFFLLSNAAVWYAWYPPTWSDLTRCYSLALPFLGYSLLSDVLFAAGFFGLYALAVRLHGAAQRELVASAG